VGEQILDQIQSVPDSNVTVMIDRIGSADADFQLVQVQMRFWGGQTELGKLMLSGFKMGVYGAEEYL